MKEADVSQVCGPYLSIARVTNARVPFHCMLTVQPLHAQVVISLMVFCPVLARSWSGRSRQHLSALRPKHGSRLPRLTSL